MDWKIPLILVSLLLRFFRPLFDLLLSTPIAMDCAEEYASEFALGFPDVLSITEADQ